MLRDKEQTNEEQAHRRRLEEWAGRAKASGIAELKAFAVKLLQDMDAVVVAMTLPYRSRDRPRGQDKQAQAREAFDVRSRQVRYVEASCTVRISSLRAQPATRRELEPRSSDFRENRGGGSNPSTCRRDRQSAQINVLNSTDGDS